MALAGSCYSNYDYVFILAVFTVCRVLLTGTPLTMLSGLLFRSGFLMQIFKHLALSALPSGKYRHWSRHEVVTVFKVSFAAEEETENFKKHMLSVLLAQKRISLNYFYSKMMPASEKRVFYC